MKTAADGAVFSLFSTKALYKALAGKKIGGILKELGVPKSSAYRLEESQDIEVLLRTFDTVGDDYLQRFSHEVRSGRWKIYSRVANFFHPNLCPFWDDYATSMRIFDYVEILEDESRERFNMIGVEDLINAVLSLSIEIEQPTEREDKSDEGKYLPVFDFIEENRPELVRQIFFFLIANLDIDLCASRFKGRRPRMMLPIVMPVIRKIKGGRTYAISPERRLFDLCYCLAVGCKKAPSLDDMVDGDDKIRGNIERRTMGIEDYLEWFKVWAKKSGRIDEFESDGKDSRWSSFVVIYFFTKTLSLVFSDVGAKEHAKILNIFYRNYHAMWMQALSKRGINEDAGELWDDDDLFSCLIGEAHDEIKAY